ncbi:hypothetical protein OR16_05342 [Cupriavidus basilensis OR16]|uniref:Uncharacterized protein n=1 Tax=Cupriavidus basilensis OR16 TaxID=1127483 RepID=H1S0E3_9BURK|nr:hypothetical protein OR16_05342 [Cupriavidus basilensis OR16]
MALRPVPAAAQLPAIDDVADQVELVRFIVLEEIEQVIGLAARRAEVNVGQPDGAVVTDSGGRALAGEVALRTGGCCRKSLAGGMKAASAAGNDMGRGGDCDSAVRLRSSCVALTRRPQAERRA